MFPSFGGFETSKEPLSAPGVVLEETGFGELLQEVEELGVANEALDPVEDIHVAELALAQRPSDYHVKVLLHDGGLGGAE